MKRFIAWVITAVLLLSAVGCQSEPPVPSVAEVKVMSWNLLNPAWGGGPAEMRSEPFVRTIENEHPDVLGVQEAASSWHTEFKTLPSQYEPVNAARENGKAMMTSFLYNTDTLTLIENGIEDLDADSNIRVVSWAVFEVNGTSVRFLITNTHPDSREAQCLLHTEQYLDIVNKLRDEKALPLLSVGDFNAIETSKAYKLHTLDCFTDCKYADGVEVVQDIDSYLLGDYGGRVTKGQGSRDHIFFKGDVSPMFFTTLSENDVTTVSDHLPVVAVVTIGGETA